MRWEITFTQNYVYEVETDSRISSYDDYLRLRQDAFNQAYDEFRADTGSSTCDDYEIEELDEWGDEEDED